MADNRRWRWFRLAIDASVANVGAIAAWVKATLIPASLVGALIAWGAWASGIFQQYAPLSWIVAGVGGFLLFGGAIVIGHAIWQISYVRRVRAKYDERALELGSTVNPLDRTFEGKRIFLNTFVLPSHTFIDGKTFIGCEIIGPANVYWAYGNNAKDMRGPRVDAVYLDPKAVFYNGFTFTNCFFRDCSFQRLTLFVGLEDYPLVRQSGVPNWISLTPSEEQLALPVPPPSEGGFTEAEDQKRISPPNVTVEDDTKN